MSAESSSSGADKPGFGDGHFVGDYLTMEIYNLPARDQARMIGRAAGCPVVERLTDPENTAPGRGPEAMAKRYGEVSFWFTYLVGELKKSNPDLAEQFQQTLQRKPGDAEGMMLYDTPSIPADHFANMYPLGTLPGYALPRVFIEELDYRGEDSESTPEDVQGRMVAALDAFEDAAKVSETKYELVARFSEAVIGMDANPEAVLSHVLARGWLSEHGANWMFDDMEAALREHAPVLWKHYQTEA